MSPPLKLVFPRLVAIPLTYRLAEMGEKLEKSPLPSLVTAHPKPKQTNITYPRY